MSCHCVFPEPCTHFTQAQIPAAISVSSLWESYWNRFCLCHAEDKLWWGNFSWFPFREVFSCKYTLLLTAYVYLFTNCLAHTNAEGLIREMFYYPSQPLFMEIFGIGVYFIGPHANKLWVMTQPIDCISSADVYLSFSKVHVRWWSIDHLLNISHLKSLPCCHLITCLAGRLSLKSLQHT